MLCENVAYIHARKFSICYMNPVGIYVEFAICLIHCISISNSMFSRRLAPFDDSASKCFLVWADLLRKFFVFSTNPMMAYHNTCHFTLSFASDA